MSEYVRSERLGPLVWRAAVEVRPGNYLVATGLTRGGAQRKLRRQVRRDQRRRASRRVERWTEA